MGKPLKIVTVVGARPQFIKAAVLRKRAPDYGIDEVLVHTGQHYDHGMSDVFFSELGIKTADYKLDLQHRSHGGMTGEIMTKFEEILDRESCDWCVVYGDTNSTLAAALTAAKRHIPVCHIEAGLRSFNKMMPEEINRILTDHVSDLLFCPTRDSVANLQRENLTKGVFHVGDIMFDAVKMFAQAAPPAAFWQTLGIDPARPIALVTLHRADTVGDPARMNRVLDYIRAQGQDYQLVFPIHPNTRRKCDEFSISLAGFHLLDPQPYLAMQSLLRAAKLVMTDSGGVQKEAYFHGVRCVTLRDDTEWVETITAGWNRLWTKEQYACAPKPIADYGTGQCSDLILQKLLETTP
jgi:UDP-GlcNAc3NAcA epimerase